MKTLTSLFILILVSITSLFAVDDAAYVANWKLPIYSWLANEGVVPTVGIDAYPRLAITADSVPETGFDGVTGNFDAVWNSIPGSGNIIGAEGHRLGKVESEHGSADFSGAFKVLFDDYNIYILMQYTDENITGNETFEIMWAQDFKIDAMVALAQSKSQAPLYGYTRYAAFGAMKALYSFSSFNSSMLIVFDGGGTGSINLSATSASLMANLFLDNKGATTGAGVVKKVFTIGYPALTGEQRPNFDINSWRALNGGKGISFDIKVNDIDEDDVSKPAEYWWNTTHNSGWLCTWYSGFIAPKQKTNTALKSVTVSEIFSKITTDKVELSEITNVAIFSISGKQIKELNNVKEVDLTGLKKGVYLLCANGQTLKVVQ